ncbi:LTA synthase family protein [Desulfovibrio cuneatus]|uniref:LTA synthase family protein n=1 Tax=Desulfovibrio cuneatus TaxID=159728 RepID=UPI00040A0E5F|nr:LTA synthase family protein [Desulfovibrio cuneatus]
MKLCLARILDKFRLDYIGLLAVLFLVVNTCTRFALLVAFPETLALSGALLPALAKGIVNDLATLGFVLPLPALLFLLPSNAFFKKSIGRVYTAGIFFTCSLVFIFTAFAEYFFWDEFSARFNFIAVDYLLYTNEVVHNIMESYPMAPLLGTVFALGVISTYVLLKSVRRIRAKLNVLLQGALQGNTLGSRVAAPGAIFGAGVLLFVLFSPVAVRTNSLWNEFAKNGLYELFSAYRNNQLDYRAFYKTMDKAAAFALMQQQIRDADPIFMAPAGNSLMRVVAAGPEQKKPNVIVVVMESMGSKWLGEYTPNLNELAAGGLSFTNMMSTGTRTVRGLEAVMLSVPPTPGSSIVRRPDNEHLFSLGTVFAEKGYDLSFIYGGLGFFDNMGAFFTANNYTTVDKNDFAPENKTFSNAWGQCDEDLYAQSLTLADASYTAGKLFQQVLLTTSNHRPFTYPDGKVAIPSGTGRRGAVQYTDYAIGEFMREARTRPWFDNTVFVFIGDHPSAIAGKTDVPADAYGIVSILYGPKFIQPQTVDTLSSQIDLAPTLLASLGWGYISQFFGTDARTLPKNEGRAWISTYQLVALRTNESLVVLKPGRKVDASRLSPLFADIAGPSLPEVTQRAIASYQCAYDLFVGKELTESTVHAYAPVAKAANTVIQ